MPAPRLRVDVPSPRRGIVGRLAAWQIGHATMLLGAGRARVDSAIDPAVGVVLHKKVGDPVDEGEPLCTMLVNDDSPSHAISGLLRDAYGITDEVVTVPSLIVDRLSG